MPTFPDNAPPSPPQIEYLVEGRLPDDLSQGLVFSQEELARLRRRIGVRKAGGGGGLNAGVKEPRRRGMQAGGAVHSRGEATMG